ncbi:MAG: hypothetical protein AAFN07_02950 [Pseudomonadota bacterium]
MKLTVEFDYTPAMSSEAILILGKGVIWFLLPIAFCAWEIWKLRDR